MATGTRLWQARDTARAVLTTSSGRRVGDCAAESAFFIALAVLPMMLTTTAPLRAVRPLLGRDAQPGVEHGLARLLRIVLTSRGNTAADAADRLLSGTTGGLLTLGTAVALGVAVLAVTLTSVIMAMVAVGPLLGHTQDVVTGADRGVQVVWALLRWPVGLLAIFGFVLLVHTVALLAAPGPRRRRAALLGALVSTGGAVIASVLLPLYVHVAASVSPTLGTLGGGLILLVWSYLLALSVLLGAQVRRLLAGRGEAG